MARQFGCHDLPLSAVAAVPFASLTELQLTRLREIERVSLGTGPGPASGIELAATVPAGFDTALSRDEVLRTLLPEWYSATHTNTTTRLTPTEADALVVQPGSVGDFALTRPSPPGMFWRSQRGYVAGALAFALQTVHAYAPWVVLPAETGCSRWTAQHLRAVLRATPIRYSNGSWVGGATVPSYHPLVTIATAGVWPGAFEVWRGTPTASAASEEGQPGQNFLPDDPGPETGLGEGRGDREALVAASEQNGRPIVVAVSGYIAGTCLAIDLQLWWASRLLAWAKKCASVKHYVCAAHLARLAHSDALTLARLLIHEYGHDPSMWGEGEGRRSVGRVGRTEPAGSCKDFTANAFVMRARYALGLPRPSSAFSFADRTQVAGRLRASSHEAGLDPDMTVDSGFSAYPDADRPIEACRAKIGDRTYDMDVQCFDGASLIGIQGLYMAATPTSGQFNGHSPRGMRMTWNRRRWATASGLLAGHIDFDQDSRVVGIST